MSNPKTTFRSIAPKPPAEIMQSLDDVIAVVTLPSQETQEVNSTTEITTEKASKKKNDRKQERAEEETGWDDKSTGLLLSFLEENIEIYKKNKSNFAKKAAEKVFPGKLWEQIKNKLARLVARYNEIKEKENQTGGEAQAAKWKWFERLDALLGTRENHNPTFLVDGISDDTQFFDCEKNKEEGLEETNVKKRKSLSHDPLAEAMISISNTRQIILEKRLSFESEQFDKKQAIEREIRESETAFKREELEVERIKAETLRKKMEFDMEQSRMEHQLRMKEMELRMLQYKSSSR